MRGGRHLTGILRYFTTNSGWRRICDRSLMGMRVFWILARETSVAVRPQNSETEIYPIRHESGDISFVVARHWL